MNEKPLVSILINNYNYERYLSTAIESAINRTYENVEVIVVDDGSTDNSRTVLDRYSGKVKPILKSNGGQASAINAGFKNCQGDIVCLLDSDDWFTENKVQEVVDTFQRFPEIGWFFHPMTLINQQNASEVKILPPYSEGVYDRMVEFRKGRVRFWAPATSGLCFRRSLLEKILPMPEAQGINVSDKYIKELAIGLSKGYSSSEFLAYQRVHDENLYTQKEGNLQTRIDISLNYAYWVRNNFPEFSERANREFAQSMFLNRKLTKSFKIQNGLFDEYLSTITFSKKIEIYLRATYYSIRGKFKYADIEIDRCA